jgi:hypothetical protein
VNAKFKDKSGEQAVFALISVKGGTFDFQPSAAPFTVVIHNSNTNLLLEGLRLLDEANRDLNEQETIPGNSSSQTHPESAPNIAAETEVPAPIKGMPVVPVAQFIKEGNPLEEI